MNAQQLTEAEITLLVFLLKEHARELQKKINSFGEGYQGRDLEAAINERGITESAHFKLTGRRL